jgi:1-deoxy-D-xylulose-5-phosphate synthase
MSDKLLTSINYPSDLRLLDEAQLLQLAQELRNFIIDVVSEEGHLGASLGVIELTIALHYVFNTQMIY